MKKLIALLAVVMCTTLTVSAQQVENAGPRKCDAWQFADRKTSGSVEYHHDHLHMYFAGQRVASYTVNAFNNIPKLKDIKMVSDGWQWYPVVEKKNKEGKKFLIHLLENKKNEVVVDKYGRFEFDF
jgi:hypothetical protein